MDNESYGLILKQLNECSKSKLKKGLSEYNTQDYFTEHLKEIYFSIPNIPKKVFISKEIQEKEKELDKNIRKTLKKIEDKFKKGENINLFLSTRKENNDKMFSAWRIHHLHLGEYDKTQKIYKRTKDLLYCFMPFNENSIYFIDIAPHGKWCDLDLLNILKQNWTNIFGKSNSMIIQKYSEDELKALRKNNVNALPYLPSGEVITPNLGYTINGNPAHVELAKKQIRRQMEQHLKINNIDVNNIHITDFEIGSDLTLKKMILDNSNTIYM